MQKFSGKEDMYGFTYDYSSCSYCAGTFRSRNYHLPQEEENQLVEAGPGRWIPMLRVMNTTRGCIVGDSVELADTSMTRMFGLLGRRGLDAGGGLWIKPSSGVHTFFMAFSIDVVGLDGNLKVIKLWRNLVPFRVTSVNLRMRSVLELPTGVIRQTGMAVGDQLHISSVATDDTASAS
jgi:uncharacterized membrane protein (UPF0127 family)